MRIITAAEALVELFVPMVIGLVASMAGFPWQQAAVIAVACGAGTVVFHLVIYIFFDTKREDTELFDRIEAWGRIRSPLLYVLLVFIGLRLKPRSRTLCSGRRLRLASDVRLC